MDMWADQKMFLKFGQSQYQLKYRFRPGLPPAQDHIDSADAPATLFYYSFALGALSFSLIAWCEVFGQRSSLHS